MPEPEFFILLFAAAVVFACFVVVAAVMFFFGWKENSKALMVGSVVPFGCGALVFAPMLLLLILWIGYWIFGDKSRSTEHESETAPAENHLQMHYDTSPNHALQQRRRAV